jgi:uncharacterized protein (TIGR02246 family)
VLNVHLMSSSYAVFVCALMALISPKIVFASNDATPEIRAVLDEQQAAWNRGDIDAFMNGYWHSDQTVFISGDGITRGWQLVLEMYRKKYSDRQKMGTLTFSELNVSTLGDDAAAVHGRWALKREADNPHGRFTLIFRKTADGWRIVHDHTSAAAEK